MVLMAYQRYWHDKETPPEMFSTRAQWRGRHHDLGAFSCQWNNGAPGVQGRQTAAGLWGCCSAASLMTEGRSSGGNDGFFQQDNTPIPQCSSDQDFFPRRITSVFDHPACSRS
ncbi:unnamed protein product [Pleuronectes platessa]|uniref:Uncharacterized protein n=1 Tax=Pleuronectes platessa TaxID=8262 RepID=A0A9N7YKW2_PLEPL|nr:unnamed protein product [Pleuronectes platessa]